LLQGCTKIGLLHHVGGGNLGDDATLDAVASNIKQRQPNVEFVAFTMNPEDTETRHGMVSYPIRRRPWSIGYKPAQTEEGSKRGVRESTRKCGPVLFLLKAARAATAVSRELSFLVHSRRIVRSVDALIICGGGQLTEKDGPRGFPYTIFKWDLLARSAGVRCIFLNVGAGPLTLSLSKFFVTRALLVADYVSLRDRKSQALVREIGFTGESRVYPDCVYGLDSAIPKIDQLGGGSQLRIGFAPMPYPDPDPSGYPAEADRIRYECFIGKLSTLASQLIGQSYELTFFGTDIGVDPRAIDDLQMTLLRDHGISSSQYRICKCFKSTHDLFEIVSRMDFIVTCRFHGAVFAHLLNKPVLAIAHHPKVSELMTELGLLNYCADIRDFDPNQLVEKFALMVNSAEEIKSRMAASLTENKQQLRSQFDELFSFRA